MHRKKRINRISFTFLNQEGQPQVYLSELTKKNITLIRSKALCKHGFSEGALMYFPKKINYGRLA